MIPRALAIWVLLLVLANVVGAAKVLFVIPRLGEYAGHLIGTIVFCPVIFAVTWGSIRWMNPKGSRDALLIGFFWVLLTEAFEFLAGHYLFGNSWERLLSAYNVAEGQVWILVLLTCLLSPIAAATLRGRGRNRWP